ncbi:four-carbon acid sugar kinase family protein [uncultured Selenomonas sp.]|uniref:four-carbon acid sugar kinase family protein n=1 Tax=uncultured Selenomonas sp. TaxID=159275 RepID=UPI0028DC976D|nr:four-carbon acid sugar kinase family protein [uncultured Selenomonas sp.]
MEKRFLIVADDFTGANDTGVQLKRYGIPVEVLLDGKQSPGDISLVLDTESRALMAGAAGRKVKRMLEGVELSEFSFVIKKVDSTLRGNVAEEIAALDAVYQSELIVFAPAFPDLGRTTVRGVHQLHGVRISETEIGCDPKNPVLEDRLEQILRAAFEEDVRQYGLSEIRGSLHLGEARICCFDSETNDDMQGVVRTAMASGKRVLWVGSAAIADMLLRTLRQVRPAFAICGSVSDVTRRQIHTTQQAGIHLVSVPVPEFLHGDAKKETYVEACSEILHRGGDVVLLSSASYDRTEIERSVQAGKKCGMGLPEIGTYVQNLLGEIGAAVLEKNEIAGIFLTGGDTAMGFLQRIGARGSSIQEEIAIGIPKMRILGGEYDGMSAVTKAGAFGSDGDLLYALRKLKEWKD